MQQRGLRLSCSSLHFACLHPPKIIANILCGNLEPHVLFTSRNSHAKKWKEFECSFGDIRILFNKMLVRFQYSGLQRVYINNIVFVLASYLFGF